MNTCKLLKDHKVIGQALSKLVVQLAGIIYIYIRMTNRVTDRHIKCVHYMDPRGALAQRANVTGLPLLL